MSSNFSVDSGCAGELIQDEQTALRDAYSYVSGRKREVSSEIAKKVDLAKEDLASEKVNEAALAILNESRESKGDPKLYEWEVFRWFFAQEGREKLPWMAEKLKTAIRANKFIQLANSVLTTPQVGSLSFGTDEAEEEPSPSSAEEEPSPSSEGFEHLTRFEQKHLLQVYFKGRPPLPGIGPGMILIPSPEQIQAFGDEWKRVYEHKTLDRAFCCSSEFAILFMKSKVLVHIEDELGGLESDETIASLSAEERLEHFKENYPDIAGVFSNRLDLGEVNPEKTLSEYLKKLEDEEYTPATLAEDLKYLLLVKEEPKLFLLHELRDLKSDEEFVKRGDRAQYLRDRYPSIVACLGLLIQNEEDLQNPFGIRDHEARQEELRQRFGELVKREGGYHETTQQGFVDNLIRLTGQSENLDFLDLMLETAVRDPELLIDLQPIDLQPMIDPNEIRQRVSQEKQVSEAFEGFSEEELGEFPTDLISAIPPESLGRFIELGKRLEGLDKTVREDVQVRMTPKQREIAENKGTLIARASAENFVQKMGRRSYLGQGQRERLRYVQYVALHKCARNEDKPDQIAQAYDLFLLKSDTEYSSIHPGERVEYLQRNYPSVWKGLNPKKIEDFTTFVRENENPNLVAQKMDSCLKIHVTQILTSLDLVNRTLINEEGFVQKCMDEQDDRFLCGHSFGVFSQREKIIKIFEGFSEEDKQEVKSYLALDEDAKKLFLESNLTEEELKNLVIVASRLQEIPESETLYEDYFELMGVTDSEKELLTKRKTLQLLAWGKLEQNVTKMLRRGGSQQHIDLQEAMKPIYEESASEVNIIGDEALMPPQKYPKNLRKLITAQFIKDGHRYGNLELKQHLEGDAIDVERYPLEAHKHLDSKVPLLQHLARFAKIRSQDDGSGSSSSVFDPTLFKMLQEGVCQNMEKMVTEVWMKCYLEELIEPGVAGFFPVTPRKECISVTKKSEKEFVIGYNYDFRMLNLFASDPIEAQVTLKVVFKVPLTCGHDGAWEYGQATWESPVPADTDLPDLESGGVALPGLSGGVAVKKTKSTVLKKVKANS